MLRLARLGPLPTRFNFSCMASGESTILDRMPTAFLTFWLLLGLTFTSAGAMAAGVDAPAEELLGAVTITSRDLKTLHYMENAHGQLEEWSRRLLSRLQRGSGPRDQDPILDGRADLQVKKIEVTYAGYTHTPELAEVLRRLAAAHLERLQALQRMVRTGADREQFNELDAPIQQLVGLMQSWSKQHEH